MRPPIGHLSRPPSTRKGPESSATCPRLGGQGQVEARSSDDRRERPLFCTGGHSLARNPPDSTRFTGGPGGQGQPDRAQSPLKGGIARNSALEGGGPRGPIASRVMEDRGQPVFLSSTKPRLRPPRARRRRPHPCLCPRTDRKVRSIPPTTATVPEYDLGGSACHTCCRGHKTEPGGEKAGSGETHHSGQREPCRRARAATVKAGQAPSCSSRGHSYARPAARNRTGRWDHPGRRARRNRHRAGSTRAPRPPLQEVASHPFAQSREE